MKMKSTTSFLRTLSTRLLSPSPVVPWPQPRSAFDRWLTSELDDLQLHDHTRYTSAAWLSKALDVAIAAQKSVASSMIDSVRHKDLDYHADVTVELLDACNVAKQRIDAVRAYVNSVTIALHCLECANEPSRAALMRACSELDSCAAMEMRCAELDRCGSSLRKLGERLAAHDRRLAPESDIHEALIGSRSVALLAVAMVEIAVSFRTRQGVPSVVGGSGKSSMSWVNLLSEIHKGAKEEFDKRRGDGVPALEELAVTASAAQRLRGLVCSRDRQVELRRRCRDLEERLRPLEERIDVLYMELIGVRMSLLGMLTEA